MFRLSAFLVLLAVSVSSAGEPTPVDRGKHALTQNAYIPAFWSSKAIANAWKSCVEAKPGRLQRVLEQLGVMQVDAGAQQTGLRVALVGMGLLPPVAQTLAQDLGWLADVTEQHKPFAAVVHCLCGAQ